MLSHANCAAIDAEASGDFCRIEGIDIEHSQELAIFRSHRFQRAADLFAPVSIDQSRQRIRLFTSDERLRAPEPPKGARLAMRAAAMMQTDVARRLKDERRKRIEIVHAFLPERLQNPPNRLLSHVFRDVAIAQPARRKYAQAQPEAFSQLRGKCIGRSIGAGGQ
jgi:hypothetical protein